MDIRHSVGPGHNVAYVEFNGRVYGSYWLRKGKASDVFISLYKLEGARRLDKLHNPPQYLIDRFNDYFDMLLLES